MLTSGDLFSIWEGRTGLVLDMMGEGRTGGPGSRSIGLFVTLTGSKKFLICGDAVVLDDDGEMLGNCAVAVGGVV